MKALPILALAALALAGCPSNNGNNDGGNGADAGGDGGPVLQSGFKTVTLDSTPNEATFLAMAVGPGDKVGVAYFQRGDGGIQGSLLLDDGGTGQSQIFPNYDLKYVEWTAAGGATAPQTIVTVQTPGLAGVAIAYQPNGQPAVAYLGGPNKGATDPQGTNGSPYWFQQNAVISYRQANGTTWNAEVIDDYSTNVEPPQPCLYNGTGPDSNPLGIVLGIFPALQIDPSGVTYLAYRDVHSGQFPVQDWQASDLKIATLPAGYGNTARPYPASGGTSFCKANPTSCTGIAWGGNDHTATPGHGGYGGHNAMVLGANGRPAVVTDQVQGNAVGQGQNVMFYQSTGVAAWTCSVAASGCNNLQTPAPYSPPFCQTNPNLPLLAQIGNTGTGPAIAYDPVADGGIGYGVAFVDLNSNSLSFMQSADGTSWPSAPDTFLNQGTGGWYPSLAIDPAFHIPNVAFFMCAAANSQTQCDPASWSPTGSNIQIATYSTGAGWQFQVVDPAGFFSPKIAFLSTGKRVLVYDLRDYSLRLAVEQ